MARLFPNKPAGTISTETAKVLHALRRVPGEELLVWIRMPGISDWRPELMVVFRDQSCHLIAVSTLGEASIETAVHGDLFSSPQIALKVGDIGLVERTNLAAFRDGVLHETAMTYGANSLPIRCVVAFPNVPQALLDEVVNRAGVSDCCFWGRETIRTEPMLRKIEACGMGARPLPKEVVDCLRKKFSPEIQIPENFVARIQEKAERELGPKLTGFLLDLDQEWLAKEDLALSAEAGAAVGERRLRLVTGVAGSGKTLILLYRAMFQAKLRPDAKILILTHNRPLTGELRDRFLRLCPGSNVDCRTFYQWCREISGEHWKNIIASWDREALLTSLVSTNPVLARMPLAFLGDELDWIRDQGIFRRDDYLAVARIGRKRPLAEEQRAAVFTLLREYQKSLNARQLTDWSGAAFAVWRHVQENTATLPVYDLLFVDEAQFFAPVWFQLVRSSISPERSQLFLAADPTQGFLKRRQSWLASGLDVRGQSTRLLKSYRNTRQILSFAARLYRSRLPDEDEEINLPDAEEMERLPEGESPHLLWIDSPQGERARIANEIVAAIRAGARPEHFLVLHAEDAMVEQFIETINGVARKGIARNLKKDLTPGNCGLVRVSSLNAATGLESPVVFLCGLDTLLEKECALGLEEDDRQEIVRDNTRRIYMGITRAGCKLVIPYRRPETLKVMEGRG